MALQAAALTKGQAGETVSLTSFAGAVSQAAAALASIGGASGLTGASMPSSATIQGSGPLFGVTAGTGVAAFAGGGIMTSRGVAQLRRYATGGIADSPQLAIYGEGSMPEAFVPLPDGRTIPVTLKTEEAKSAPYQFPTVTVKVINTGEQQGQQQGGMGGPRLDAQKLIQDAVTSGLQRPGPFRDAVKNALR